MTLFRDRLPHLGHFLHKKGELLRVTSPLVWYTSPIGGATTLSAAKIKLIVHLGFLKKLRK
jgi:hypothetical protein